MTEALHGYDDERLYEEDKVAAVEPFDAAEFARTFTHRTEIVDDVRLHYVVGGKGEPLLLLHGWPASWYEYRKAMPLLAERFTVIAADLPGMADSSAPRSYDKKTYAAYFARFLEQLGHDRVFLAGHDVGGPVAFAIAAWHGDKVERLALPETALAGPEQDQMVLNAWPNLWHFAVNAAPGVVESLLAGRERLYLSNCFTPWSYNPAAIGEADLDEYARTYSMPGKMVTSCSYYRTFPQDARDTERFADDKLKMPVLYLAADHSMGSPLMGERVPYRSIEKFCEDIRYELISNCGHWVAEERPVYLARRLTDFFSEG